MRSKASSVADTSSRISALSIDSEETTGKALLKLLRLPHNRICADCRTPLADSHNIWVSLGSNPLPYAVFVCVPCCSAHRSITNSSCRTKSVHMDSWSHEEVGVSLMLVLMSFMMSLDLPVDFANTF